MFKDVAEFSDNEVIMINQKFTSKNVKIKMHPNPDIKKVNSYFDVIFLRSFL